MRVHVSLDAFGDSQSKYLVKAAETCERFSYTLISGENCEYMIIYFSHYIKLNSPSSSSFVTGVGDDNNFIKSETLKCVENNSNEVDLNMMTLN